MEKPNSKGKSGAIKTALVWVASVVAVAAVLYGVGYSTGIVQKNLTAVKVNDYNVNALEFRYYYTNSKNSFLNQYGSYLTENGVDLNKPLENQVFQEGKTWGQYLTESATNEIKEIYAMYHEAKANNYVQTEDITTAITLYLEQLDATAEQNNLTTDQMIQKSYGKHLNRDLVKSYIENRYYAIGYVNKVQEDFVSTPEALEEFYQKNKNDFDYVDYNIFNFDFATVEGDDAATTKNKEDAKAKADEMLAKVTDRASFSRLALEYAPADKKDYYSDLNSTFISNGKMVADAGPISDWYSDQARVAGDKTVVEGTNSYAVILFQDRYIQDYTTQSVRHILIGLETAETHEHEGDTEHSDSEFDANAKKKADEVYALWNASDKTEDTFAKLASEHTTDTGSASVGGLYEEFEKNKMVPAFEAWAYAAGRKPGDTTIVKSEYGYHIMYYVGTGRPAWQVASEFKLAEETFNTFFDGVIEKSTVKSNPLAMSMAY